MARFLIACWILFFAASMSLSQETNNELEDYGIVEPLILEIPEEDFFVLSLHKLDGVKGEFEATVYLSLNSVPCDDPRASSHVKMPVGDGLFPFLIDDFAKGIGELYLRIRRGWTVSVPSVCSRTF